jgi:hypothetical protein
MNIDIDIWFTLLIDRCSDNVAVESTSSGSKKVQEKIDRKTALKKFQKNDSDKHQYPTCELTTHTRSVVHYVLLEKSRLIQSLKSNTKKATWSKHLSKIYAKIAAL